MSILMNPERVNPSVFDRAREDGLESAEGTRSLYSGRSGRREYEPPEESYEDSEGPEQRARLHVEAPDAGEPQVSHDDRELRHGRSRG
jgi:hypothetical protein